MKNLLLLAALSLSGATTYATGQEGFGPIPRTGTTRYSVTTADTLGARKACENGSSSVAKEALRAAYKMAVTECKKVGYSNALKNISKTTVEPVSMGVPAFNCTAIVSVECY